ncbi:hypothetical protein HanIR_Chr09g0444141 [Helianthus annuus]|nr:hypothetical protein HanIR_Chr09g0444141 [Helianthus annuus]
MLCSLCRDCCEGLTKAGNQPGMLFGSSGFAVESLLAAAAATMEQKAGVEMIQAGCWSDLLFLVELCMMPLVVLTPQLRIQYFAAATMKWKARPLVCVIRSAKAGLV